MLKLFLLRHGKACNPKLDQKDYDRPLNKKGIAQINQLAFHLKTVDIGAKELKFSSAKRTEETALILNHHCNFDKITNSESLYLAKEEFILKHLNENGEHANLVYVGHNFGISNLASILSGKHISMSTGMLIELHFNFDDWSAVIPGSGKIASTFKPDIYLP